MVSELSSCQPVGFVWKIHTRVTFYFMHPGREEIHRYYTRRVAQQECEIGIEQVPSMADEQGGARQNRIEDEEREMMRTLITTQPRIVKTLDRL